MPIDSDTSPPAHISAPRSAAERTSQGLAPTTTSGTNRYQSVDPQTSGRLRILRIGDIELQLDGHRLVVRGEPVHLPHKEFMIPGS